MKPFDLEAPAKSLLAAMAEPRPCLVCGRPRTGLSPLRNIGAEHTHAACDRDVDRWERQIAEAADNEPSYVSMQAAIGDLQETAERVWEGKARSLGLPDWVVQRAIDSHRQGWHDDE